MMNLREAVRWHASAGDGAGRQPQGLLGPEVYSYLAWMAENPGIHVLSDAQWAELEPLIDAVRPHRKVPHDDLRQTIEAILWRHRNGAKWRAIPGELGPWWKAA